MSFDEDYLAKEFVDLGANTIPKIVTALYETNAVGEGKARWLDKTPYYVGHLPAIRGMFPDAKFVHIIRDGRDCCLSMLRRKHDLRIFNVFGAAKTWKRFVDSGQGAGRSLIRDCYMEVHYEALVADPGTVMEDICKFVNEEFDDSLVDFEKSTDPLNKTPLLSRPIQTDNTDKWRRGMAERDVRVFESVAGDTLMRNGYAVVGTQAPLSIVERVGYKTHVKVANWYSRRFVNRPRK